MRSAAELMRAYYEALNEPNLDALEGLSVMPVSAVRRRLRRLAAG